MRESHVYEFLHEKRKFFLQACKMESFLCQTHFSLNSLSVKRKNGKNSPESERLEVKVNVENVRGVHEGRGDEAQQGGFLSKKFTFFFIFVKFSFRSVVLVNDVRLCSEFSAECYIIQMSL